MKMAELDDTWMIKAAAKRGVMVRRPWSHGSRFVADAMQHCGYSVREISAEIGLSPWSVYQHLRNGLHE